MNEEVGKIRIADIQAKHPFPWQDRVHPNGNVQLIDANGVEVGLFMILAHCVITTQVMARQGAKA